MKTRNVLTAAIFMVTLAGCNNVTIVGTSNETVGYKVKEFEPFCGTGHPEQAFITDREPEALSTLISTNLHTVGGGYHAKLKSYLNDGDKLCVQYIESASYVGAGDVVETVIGEYCGEYTPPEPTFEKTPRTYLSKEILAIKSSQVDGLKNHELIFKK